MKINKQTIEQMKTELLFLFAIDEAAGITGTKADFIAEPTRRASYWVRFHVWAIASIENFPSDKRHLFETFPFNEDHLLYPCDTSDSTLKTALTAIAKEIQG